MKSAKHIYQLFTTLSIEVVLGALCTGILAIKLTSAVVPPAWWVILPLSTWIIYTTDHLLDGLKGQGKSIIERHHFHYIYKKKLFVFILLGSLITLLLVRYYFSKMEVLMGMMLTTFVGLYFGLLNFTPAKFRRWIPKEWIIALVYVTGIWFIPVMNASIPLTTEHFLFVGIFIILVWCESALASWFEQREDQLDGHSSITTQIGPQTTQKFIAGLLSLTVSFLIGLTVLYSHNYLVVSAASLLILVNSGLMVMVYYPLYFSHHNRYRWFGEGLFLLPGLIIFVN